MADVPDWYAEPYDPNRPVVAATRPPPNCWGEVRAPLPAQPGRSRRQDYEYRRAGTRNLFRFGEPRAGWRQLASAQRRALPDLARRMQWPVDTAYPHALVIRVVLDNPVSSTGQALNTHRMASRYETFPPPRPAAS